MKEVKFRAKVLKTNNWIYRQPFHIRGTWYMYSSLWTMVPIEHKTIGQYTGLTDKNGVEIYEGDIVDYGASDLSVIKYEDGSFWARLGQYPMHVIDEYEVKGNIYDHSHLLEDAQ